MAPNLVLTPIPLMVHGLHRGLGVPFSRFEACVGPVYIHITNIYASTHILLHIWVLLGFIHRFCSRGRKPDYRGPVNCQSANETGFHVHIAWGGILG